MNGENESSLHTVITVVGILLLLVVLVVGGKWYIDQKVTESAEKSDTTEVSEEVKKYVEKMVETNKVVETSPEPVKKTKEELIKEAFAEKYDRTPKEVKITINEEKSTTTHIMGGVGFEGEMGGGWFLAAKVEGEWKIAADGNGTVMCDDIAPFNFPTTMVPECWDENTQELVVR